MSPEHGADAASAWLGVVSAEHVRRGVELSIAQIGHGKMTGLKRMRAGDTLVFYSPTERLRDGIALRQFTAIGVVPDDEIWQADDGDFHPYRRQIAYARAHTVDLDDVREQLVLTSTPNWGYQLRRGLVPLDDRDANLLRHAMTTP